MRQVSTQTYGYPISDPKCKPKMAIESTVPCVVGHGGAEPGRGHCDGDAHPGVVVGAVVVHDGALQLWQKSHRKSM